MNTRFKDRTGQRFGRLLVIRLSGKDKSRKNMWECLCDCGRTSLVQISNLRSGNCRSCGECLPNGNFGKRQSHCNKGHEFTEDNTYVYPSTGRRTCKICMNETHKTVSIKNKDRILELKRARRKLRPDCTPEQRREKNLNHIGWNTELFNQKLEEQEGKCAICKKLLTMEKKISGSRACADHEHSDPPKPRGILCVNCNLGIGNLQDDPVIMQAAIEYIRKFI